MFTNDSTENLLDNLENELTEVIELEEVQDFKKVIETRVEIENEKTPPIPARRNVSEPSEAHSNPVPAARRLQPLDKKEKNDENEIIQLSSMSSSSASELHRNVSQNTVVVAKERKTMAIDNEAFVKDDEPAAVVVSKRGKWAQEEKPAKAKKEPAPVELKEMKTPIQSPATMKSVNKKPHIEVVTEKPKKTRKPSTSSNLTSTQTSFESSSETSSSEESLKPKKKSKKKPRSKDKKKSKKKIDFDDQATSSESSSAKEDKSKFDSTQAIGKLEFCVEFDCYHRILSFQAFSCTQPAL